jgi:hypothetical protein
MELTKFTPFDWDKNTTPRMLYEKAIEHLKHTEVVRRAGRETCLLPMLYDQFESVCLGPRFQYDTHNFPPDGPLPRHRCLAIYAVEGDNEGHYIHVDFITVSDITAQDRKMGINRWEAIPLMYMKTFGGLEFSLEVVAVLTRFFNFNK